MTGYGRKKSEGDTLEITFEMRSVNHRYLDINLKVPRTYGYLEEIIKKRISATVNRGKIDIFLSIRAQDGANIKITPNIEVIKGYSNAFEIVKNLVGTEDKLFAHTLMNMPDALSIDKEEADADALIAEVMATAEEVIAEFEAMRKREGESLCKDILERSALIAQYVSLIEERSPNSVNEYKERLTARMEELLDGTDASRDRILIEAAVFADKVSVTEEIIRLKSHLNQLSEMIIGTKSVGRKLDFLIQEINREVNTIGSKANDYEIAKTVVEMKAEIEKIREQVQNLE